ncbi:MAG TPA: amidohydrolase family protein [Stellaceae bacterium]|nr:amidohydrolase family protein [Stellaceae bacterium]
MEIIDGHTHIASTRFIPPDFVEGVVDNMMEQMRLTSVEVPRSRILDRLLAYYQDHEGRNQLLEMDRLGIARAVVLLPDFTYAFRCKGDALSIAEMFWQHKLIRDRSDGRFEVFAGVDPRWGADGFRLFVKGIEEYGFAGLKLYPPCGYRPDDALLEPYYDYCQERRLPVLIHIGPTSPRLSFTEALPIFVDAPARKYANVSFILAHGAVSYPQECVQLCRYRPNVYLDLSGAQTHLANPDARGELCQLFARGINHKLIFGTDWPINTQTALNRGLIKMFSIAPDVKPYISAADTQWILSGTIKSILNRRRAAAGGVERSADDA